MNTSDTIPNQHAGRRPVDWCRLPPELLAYIFTWLHDQDKLHARLTCKLWKRVFLLPEFWREHLFFFSGDDKQNAHTTAYMQSFGSHLRHLWLLIDEPMTQKKASSISKGVKALNSHPPGMKLKTLVCEGLKYIHEPQYRCEKLRILKAFCNLLKNQSKYLIEVDLSYNYMEVQAGCRVLQALATHKAHPKSVSTAATCPLTLLALGGFFRRNVPVADHSSCSDVMGRFGALQTLYLNLSYLGDKGLESVSRGSPLLEWLYLRVDGHYWDLNDPLSSCAGWRDAVQRCPKLRVSLHTSGRNVDFQKVLVPGMPLASFSTIFHPRRDVGKVSFMLERLSHHFAPYLKRLLLHSHQPYLSWSPPVALVELVSRCRSLACLSVQMTLPEPPLDTVLQLAAARPHSASLLAPAAALHIYLGEDYHYNPKLEEEDLEKLAAVNSCCFVHFQDPEKELKSSQ